MAISDYVAYINTTQIHRVAVVLFIVLLGVGMGVGFSVASTNARKDADADYNRRLAIFSQWQMDLTSHFTKASSLAATAASFVFSTALIPANMTAPSTNRSKVLVNPEAFNRLCSQVYIPGVSIISLVPGGAMSQLYPPSFAAPGLDMYNNNVYKHFFPTLTTVPGVLTGGPSKLATRPGYGIFVFFPIHVSNVTNLSTFWGITFVLLEIPVLLGALNVSSVMAKQGMNYAMWYTTDVNGTVPTIVAESDPAVSAHVLEVGMRMKLPISEAGRQSYLAMHPVNGEVSSSIKVSTAVIIVVATLLGVLALVSLVYLCAYLHFLYRHRRAPASHSTMYVAALALRGAQPIADRAPLVAVQMFNEFNSAVRRLALLNDCYPICEIGDRCVYVASKNPENLLALSQAAVLEIAVKGAIPTAVDGVSLTHTQTHLNRSRSVSHVSYARTATHVSKALTTQISEEMTQSSFIGASICHPSVACHTMSATSVYDAARDVYFFGSAAQLGKLCGALDLAKCGEVCWTDAFEQKNPQLCRGAASAALTSHMVSENGEVVLHVASWWKESGDERDNEDPSTAMAVLSDAYVRRMTVIVSEGKDAKSRKRKGDSSETRSGNSSKTEATALTRTATLLHVAIISGDEKNALEIVRKIVTEEKGAVVSAHESTIVAAFNLLSAGGHHQVRAADTVMRLRDALPSTHFACSIQHGKVGALIMDGLVMCTGEAVSQGRALLQTAIALSTQTPDGPDTVTYLNKSLTQPTSLDESAKSPKRKSEMPPLTSGLCLLCCHSELSSTYDCEAIDIVTQGFCKPKIVFRLAYRRSGKATDDEWMYRLKDEEDQSPFAIVNAVFGRIACHDLDEATRLWREHVADGGAQTFEVSQYAKTSIAKYLKAK